MQRILSVYLLLVVLSSCNLPQITDIQAGESDAIPCESQALIDAIRLANETPDTEEVIELSEDCDYTLRQSLGSVGIKGNTQYYALPRITSPIVIQGNGATLLRDSVDPFAFFVVRNSGKLTLTDMNLVGGSGAYGGAILNRGQLTIIESYLGGNVATEFGGAIHTDASDDVSLTLRDVHFFGNTAGTDFYSSYPEGGGGAVSVLSILGDLENVVSVEITNCIFHWNRAGYTGGALRIGNAKVIIDQSYFWDNWALGGGAIRSQAQLSIENSTFYFNQARIGGAIINAARMLSVVNSTFAHNGTRFVGLGDTSKFYGHAIYVFEGPLILNYSTLAYNGPQRSTGSLVVIDSPRVDIGNSIFANHSSDCYFSSTSRTNLTEIGLNLDTSNGCIFETVDDLRIGLFGAYGGPLLTVPLLDGSPAIDTASGLCPDTDERGETRPMGAACDIGAFERQGEELIDLQFIDSTLPDDPIFNITFEQPGVTILRQALCQEGPSPEYPTVSALEEQTGVDLIGRNGASTYVVVEHPEHEIPCWVDVDFIDVVMINVNDLLVIDAPPLSEDQPDSGIFNCMVLSMEACIAHSSCEWIPDLTQAGAGRCQAK